MNFIKFSRNNNVNIDLNKNFNGLEDSQYLVDFKEKYNKADNILNVLNFNNEEIREKNQKY